MSGTNVLVDGARTRFQLEHIQALLDAGLTSPAVNRIERHAALQQPELREFHNRHGIVTEAWAPLAQAAASGEPVITGIAKRLSRMAAQVVLRGHLQLGNVVIPKSVTPARISSQLRAARLQAHRRGRGRHRRNGHWNPERTAPRCTELSVATITVSKRE
jgi:diketogulonate reductase-like aldo/keto reductase